MKLSEIKLGIITLIISEYMVAVITVRNAFKLVTQLVTQKTDLVGRISQVFPQSAGKPHNAETSTHWPSCSVQALWNRASLQRPDGFSWSLKGADIESRSQSSVPVW